MCRYKISNTIIKLRNLEKAFRNSKMELFQTTSQNSDVIYNIKYTDNIKRPINCIYLYSNSQFAVIIKDNRKFFIYTLDEIVYAILEEKQNNLFDLYLNISFLKNKVHPYLFPSLLHFEINLIKKDALVFHSSYINILNNAVLFTAPSGGGKSTQAELWKKYKNAEIVNGDKSIIGKENGKWYAYGIPFSGSSEYCLNRTCALKAIVILDKGPLNTLIPVGIRGFSNVFSQVTVNPWDKEFCNKAMDLVMDVCNEVPIYYYSCTKTPEAVEVLYQEFIEKGILNGSV